MSSGLDIIQSISALRDHAKSALRDYLFDLRLRTGIGTKLAARIASDMAINLVSPIMAQIDPTKLGEHQRALNVALAYGIVLNEKFNNSTNDNVNKLLSGYPSHSFVIDRKEASNLFNRVREPTPVEVGIEKFLIKIYGNLSNANVQTSIIDIRDTVSTVKQIKQTSQEKNDECQFSLL